MIDTQMPIIPIYHYVNVGLQKPAVEGLPANPRNMIVYKALRVKK